MHMRVFQYLYYFFNSLINRGIVFTFKLMYYEWKTERQLGIKTLQIKNLDTLTLDGGDTQNSHHYQAASYYILNNLFNNLPPDITAGDFIDYGCGKGRVIIVAAQHGFKNIYGVELAKELCDEAEENILRVKLSFSDTKFHISFANAANFDIPDSVDVFYFFNPFTRPVMESVLVKMQESLARNPRKVYVIYVNPKHATVFTSNGYRIHYELKSRRYTEGLILTK